jgi:hypothetical protein
MRSQMIMFAVGIFVLGTVLMCITSGRWLLNDEVNIINALASFENKQFGDFVTPNFFISFFNAVITAVSWHYPGTWLDETANGWVIFIKIPLWIVSIGVIVAMVEAARLLIQGVVSTMKTILG